MQELDKKILQELIYERVRSSVNVCQLVMIEQDLQKSIERAVEDDDAWCEAPELASAFVDNAWKRVEAEWRRLRSGVDMFDD